MIATRNEDNMKRSQTKSDGKLIHKVHRDDVFLYGEILKKNNIDELQRLFILKTFCVLRFKVGKPL